MLSGIIFPHPVYLGLKVMISFDNVFISDTSIICLWKSNFIILFVPIYNILFNWVGKIQVVEADSPWSIYWSICHDSPLIKWKNRPSLFHCLETKSERCFSQAIWKYFFLLFWILPKWNHTVLLKIITMHIYIHRLRVYNYTIPQHASRCT